MLNEVNGVKTMSSLDIVAYINYLRKEEGDHTELQHKHFLAKVMEVLKNTAAKFSSTVFYDSHQGAKRSRPIYNFPERETMLMVMSYSYEMQAKVFDAWKAAEEKPRVYAPIVQIPNFDDPIAAAETWFAERERMSVLKLEQSTAHDADL